VKITPTSRPVLKRVFPHVDDVDDWRAQQSLRLLWDRLVALEERVQAAEGTQGDLVSVANAQDDVLAQVRRGVGEALAIAQLARDEQRRRAEAAGGGDTGPPMSGPLVWAWHDVGGPPVDSPYTTGPQTVGDYKDYFFTLIDRTEGEAATDDWQAVLAASGLPYNPAQWAVPDTTMPHWALTQQSHTGGEPRGRLFLPTSEADTGGYYFHIVDVLATAP
jgi:hypothetical protein